MHVINARNPNDAWPQLINLISSNGLPQNTRNGPALVVPEPVATVYSHPTERFLFDPNRDSNPFFSLFEPLWMLAGRDDAEFLDEFISDFSSRFAEGGGRMHGAYGKRWRSWFPRNASAMERKLNGWPMEDIYSFHWKDYIDQLDECVRLLRENPYDRQAVIQMWDVGRDLGWKGLKDRPCNQQVLLRCDRTSPKTIPRDAWDVSRGIVTDWVSSEKVRHLDITVTCRSNDLSWGLITANACQFSFLQEYLAARIGVEVGTYTQFSNNLHLYNRGFEKAQYSHAAEWIMNTDYPARYPATRRLVDDPETFDDELRQFLDQPNAFREDFKNSFFMDVAHWVWLSNEARRAKAFRAALDIASNIKADDWRIACVEWIKRRIK